jgi:hypothetical protein
MCPIQVVWSIIVTSASLLDIRKRSISLAMAKTLGVIADAYIARPVTLANPGRFQLLLHPTQHIRAQAALQEPMQVSNRRL